MSANLDTNPTGKDRSKMFWDEIKSYFKLNDYLLPQDEAEAAIREGVSFKGPTILILIFAIFIASLGLNTNSTAVIIGAMLISPLMGPIIGMGLGVGINDFELIKRSARNLGMAALFSLLASTVYFLISPVSSGHSELLARTSPTIYDVLIAFFGGAAGIVALGSRSKGNVIPGVAIATALMPPLCTAGYGLATLQPQYLFGASYLFIINSIYIGFATVLGVKLMGYKHKPFINLQRAQKVRRMVMFLVVVTALPSIYLTYTMIRNNNFAMRAERFVEREFVFPNTRVLSFKADINKHGRELTVTLIGRVLPQDSLQLAMNSRLAQAGLAGTNLTIIQGDAAANINANAISSESMRDVFDVTQSTIIRQNAQIDSLRSAIAAINHADTIGAAIAPEIKEIFPQINEIAIVKPTFADPLTGDLDTLHLALVRFASPMMPANVDKLRNYLQARLATKRIEIVDVGAQVTFTPHTKKP